MTRKCSHCSNNGHNSRTCPNRGVKLFGVRLTDGLIRKSASMGNLSHYAGSSSGQLNLSNNGSDSPGDNGNGGAVNEGYASEDFVTGSSTSRERKKGTPWTEEEHRMFLLGLQKLGKGDWRGIARNYVISRTPTQVASHAQKYFIRQCNMSRRKRRSSLFDIVADELSEAALVSPDFLPSQGETQINNPLPTPPTLEEECESMDSTSNSVDGEPQPQPQPQNADNSVQQHCYPVVYPAAAYITPYFPFSFPFWSGYNPDVTKKEETHEIVRPTAVHSKSPINVDELVGLSKLSLGDSTGPVEPMPLSLKLVEGSSSRQSAFHANPTSGRSNVNTSSSPIHAV